MSRVRVQLVWEGSDHLHLLLMMLPVHELQGELGVQVGNESS